MSTSISKFELEDIHKEIRKLGLPIKGIIFEKNTFYIIWNHDPTLKQLEKLSKKLLKHNFSKKKFTKEEVERFKVKFKKFKTL